MDETDEVILSKRILESPLGLSRDIVRLLFENKYGELVGQLDLIKGFAGGITRANTLKSKYPLARFYPYMFSFHQYFNSSFRARQGLVLEKLIHTVLSDYAAFERVPEKKSEMKNQLSDLLNANFGGLDIDGFGYSPNTNKCIIIQLRSRDDTGGTTAKGSLVDLLKGILKVNGKIPINFLYIVGIWDPRDSNQRMATIKKIELSLNEVIKIDEKQLRNDIGNGYRCNSNTILRLAYGSDEIVKAIFEWSGLGNKSFLKSVPDLIRIIENWDDLWISYSVASLEVEYPAIKRYSNIDLLNDKFALIGKDLLYPTYSNTSRSIARITNSMVSIWKENSLPFDNMADNSVYIRDLLYLKAIYAKQFI